MRKWNIVFDVALCTGCHNCTIAVRDEYVGNNFPGYAAEMPRSGQQWVKLCRHERGKFPAIDVGYIFEACRHCDDPPCGAAARDGAVRKRLDGIVIIDPERARNQRQIADACPYGAVSWNEALGLPQHWNFDAHLIDAGWTAPRPVQACPTGALSALYTEDDEMSRLAAETGLDRRDLDGRHRPRLYYRNLFRMTHLLAAGTLVAGIGASEVCIAGARVRLLQAGAPLAEATTDAFGDFRFDAIPPPGGRYRLEIAAQGYRSCYREFELPETCWLGEIALEAT